MGMFDRVWVDCPECGAMVEFQSKAGACTLHDYDMDSVPPEIGRDLDMNEERCEQCNSTVKVRLQYPIQRVALTYDGNEEENNQHTS